MMLTMMLVLMACSNSKEKEASSRPADAVSNIFYVRTAAISSSSTNDAVHVKGIVQSDTEAKPSFKTGGVIARTYVKEGDLVKKGQLLAQLNMTEIEAQATQAKFAVEKAMRDKQRVENLFRDSIATLEQLQNAGTAVDMAKKSLQIAEFNVAYSEIRSPIDGKIIKQFMEAGEITGPGTPVYFVMGVQASDWKVVAGLTDKNWGRIKKGDKATITMDAYPGLAIESKVLRLSDVANPMSGTLDVELSILSKDKRIAAGLLANVDIVPSGQQEYMTIPIEALVSSNGKNGVVYVPNNGTAEKRKVMIQGFHGEYITILSGLEGVKEVITAGSGFLVDGDKIAIEQ